MGGSNELLSLSDLIKSKIVWVNNMRKIHASGKVGAKAVSWKKKGNYNLNEHKFITERKKL